MNAVWRLKSSKCKTIYSFARLWKNSCMGLMEAVMLGRAQLKEETCWMGTTVRVPQTPSNLSFKSWPLLQVGKDPPSPRGCECR